MKHTLLVAAAVAASASAFAIAPAQAQTTVTFDQSTDPTSYAAQGLVLTGFGVGSNTFGGAVILPSTPNYASVNATGSTISFVDPTTGLATTSNGFGLTTVGLNSGGGYYNGATLTFLDTLGNVLGTQTFAPVGPSEGRSPFTYTNSFANIASIGFTLIQNDRGPGLFGIDNVTFTTNAVAGAVPEPATWAMMLVGFGMVGFGLRSRRKQAVRVTYA